jgi:hypothetical protein
MGGLAILGGMAWNIETNPKQQKSRAIQPHSTAKHEDRLQGFIGMSSTSHVHSQRSRSFESLSSDFPVKCLITLPINRSVTTQLSLWFVNGLFDGP